LRAGRTKAVAPPKRMRVPDLRRGGPKLKDELSAHGAPGVRLFRW
jgi:hypothetical protein